jgi:hypothetical protein
MLTDRRLRPGRLEPSSTWWSGALFLLPLLAVLPIALTLPAAALLCAAVLATATIAVVFGLRTVGGAFVIAGFATVPLADLHPVPSFTLLELSDVLWVIGFLLLTPVLLHTPLRLPSTFVLGAIGLLMLGGLTFPTRPDPSLDFGILMHVLSGTVIFPTLVFWWRPQRTTVIAAALAYLLGNTINAVACLFQAPWGDGRYAGLSGHPNVMALTQALGIALVPFLLEALPHRHRWWVMVGAGASLYGIWISGSRAALLCVVAITLLYPLFKRSIPVALAVAGLCFPALVVVNRAIANPDPSSALGRLLGAGSASGSDAGRVLNAQVNLAKFLEHPVLGGGWDDVRRAHDVYLEVAAAIGAFGLVSYLLIVALTLKPLIAIPPPFGLLGMPALAAALIGLVDPGLGSRYLWCVVALALIADRLAETSPERTPDSTRGDALPTAARLGAGRDA